jgi:hypothetical protein
MPKVHEELPCQGEVLCHFEVLGLIKPCHCIWINEATSGMLLQELLPKIECLVERSNDLNLILKIGYAPDCPAVLVRVILWNQLTISVQNVCKRGSI